jgi:hypothetical protein
LFFVLGFFGVFTPEECDVNRGEVLVFVFTPEECDVNRGEVLVFVFTPEE